MDGNFLIKIEGPGLVVSREVEALVADEIAVKLLTNGKTTQVEVEVSETSGESLRQFLDRKQPERNVDRIVCVGCYLSEVENKSVFGRSELTERLEMVGEKVPSNMTRDLQWGVKLGWLASKKGMRGKYYLTEKGRLVVEKGFLPELVEGTSLRRGKTEAQRNKSAKSKGLYE